MMTEVFSGLQAQYAVLGSTKVKDWTNTLNAPPASIVATTNTTTTTAIAASRHIPYLQQSSTNKIKHSIKSKSSRSSSSSSSSSNDIAIGVSSSKQSRQQHNAVANSNANDGNRYNTNLFFCDDVDASAVQGLSLRLLDELRAAKSRHLTCTEVSLPCDLTSRIAAEIIRVSEKEPCGIRGCTIYIEFEDEPNNSRRIASLKIDAETVSTFEVYLTLRQDHRGWAALLPQFMKSLARTITISPEFTITKHKLYTTQQSSSSYGRQRAPLAMPSS